MVGITYFAGPATLLNIKFIENNAKFFDKFFVVADDEYHHFSNNVVVIKDTSEGIQRKLLGEVYDLHPAGVSDVLFYFPRKYLDYKYDKVMYTDINNIYTNKFLIRLLSEEDEQNKLRVHISEGFRYQNNYNDYFSADWCLDDKNSLKDKDLCKSLNEYIHSQELTYTTIGPSAVNGTRFNDFLIKYDSIRIEDVPYEVLSPGLHQFEVDRKSLGIGISNTFSKRAGIKITDFVRFNNEVVLKVEPDEHFIY